MKHMVALNQIPTAVMLLVFAGMVIGGGMIALEEFQESRFTGGVGCNSTVNSSACGPEYFAMTNASEGISEFAQQVPTIGTILGVSALIIIVVGAFSFGSRFTGGGGLNR